MILATLQSFPKRKITNNFKHKIFASADNYA